METKRIKDFTDEERLAIIRRTEEIGCKETAKEFNTSIRTVEYFRFTYAPKKGISIAKVPRIKARSDGTRTFADLTDEERLSIIRRAEEVGYKKTAEEFNTSFDTIGYCRNKYARKKGIPVVNLSLLGNKARVSSKNTFTKTFADLEHPAVIHGTEEVGYQKAGEEFSENLNSDENVKDTPVVADISDTQTVLNDDLFSLKLENEFLKTKLALINEQLKKMAEAVKNMIS